MLTEVQESLVLFRVKEALDGLKNFLVDDVENKALGYDKIIAILLKAFHNGYQNLQTKTIVDRHQLNLNGLFNASYDILLALELTSSRRGVPFQMSRDDCSKPEIKQAFTACTIDALNLLFDTNPELKKRRTKLTFLNTTTPSPFWEKIRKSNQISQATSQKIMP